MDFEHAFQQAGFISAMQILILGSLIVPGAMGRSDLYRIFTGWIMSYVVTFAPITILIYVLYAVSQLC